MTDTHAVLLRSTLMSPFGTLHWRLPLVRMLGSENGPPLSWAAP